MCMVKVIDGQKNQARLLKKLVLFEIVFTLVKLFVLQLQDRGSSFKILYESCFCKIPRDDGDDNSL
jgi:hypothetical protein